ncbi:hypothetical protein [Kosakonia cowanii]|uniref:hypothetical protein n=1 Tax=Kosakonia cowanii TaxID=208223 RepID=UPI0039B73536
MPDAVRDSPFQKRCDDNVWRVRRKPLFKRVIAGKYLNGDLMTGIGEFDKKTL